MSYLGSSATPIPVAFSGVRTQSFNGTGSASLFTLNRQVNAVTDIEVIVNNVQQSPFDGSYSIVNNGLGLQFSENPSAGTNNIYVVYRDQPLGSLIDQGAVRKTGDTMSGGLTVNGNLLVAAAPGGNRVIGAASGTDTTVVLQASTAIGGGPNIELTKDNVAYFDSNIIKFRSTDASMTYGGFDTAGRLTLPLQPAFRVIGNTSGWVAYGLNGTYFTPVGSAGQASQTTSADGSKAGFNLNDSGTRLLNRGGHMNLATGTFTAPVAGLYYFAASALFRASTVNNPAYMNLKFFVNGAEVSQPNGQYFYYQNVSSGAECAGSENVSLYLAANDQVQCRIRRANDAANAYQCYADLYHFEGCLLG